MSLVEQVEDTAMGGIGLMPTVISGIGIGILVSIVPVLLLSVGLKLTDRIFDKVVN